MARGNRWRVPGPDLGPTGPIWVLAGWHPARLRCLLRGEEQQLGQGAGVVDGMPTAAQWREFYGLEVPAGPVGPRGWYARAIASGRLLSLTMEVEPSRVPTVLLFLDPAPFRRCAGLTLRCRASRPSWRRVKVGLMEGSGAPRCRLGSGEALSARPTPTRSRLWVSPNLSGGHQGLPFLAPRRVSGETLDSSVVIVTTLLEGVDWCRRFEVMELGGRSLVGAAVTRLFRFCSSVDVGMCFILYFFHFFWT